jgi:hypothetical protein
MRAGDSRLIAKAAARARRLANRTPIFVFSCHSPDMKRAFCDEDGWVEGGRILPRCGVGEIWQRSLAARPKTTKPPPSPARAPPSDPTQTELASPPTRRARQTLPLL